MTASVLLLVVSAGCDTAAIGIVSYLTDDVLATGDLARFWRPAELWLALAGLGALASFGGGYLASWAGQHFLLGLRDRNFRHIQQLPPDFFDRSGNGDLVSRLTGDIGAVESLVTGAPVEFMASAAGAAFLAAAVWTNWLLALVAFSAAPVIWLVTGAFAVRARTAGRAERDSNGELASLLEESLANMPVVQAYNQWSPCAAWRPAGPRSSHPRPAADRRCRPGPRTRPRLLAHPHTAGPGPCPRPRRDASTEAAGHRIGRGCQGTCPQRELSSCGHGLNMAVLARTSTVSPASYGLCADGLNCGGTT
ncbi:ABC transporter transmembrane domain-containing protein [Streptomyces sp. Ag109_O5-1]|uniref:ABC transporter transmembrane domain-containing protein n=1 Tax=Streptomyces sp. Ag109_O5-1 TaxID=1938851 RepID=UPI0021A2F2EA|nr:ABC transporter transmembrane domain-containing protein [Streptomyces sp. Ag109_O5-1]